MEKQIFKTMLEDFEYGKEYFIKYKSLIYVKSDILLDIITKEGLRTAVFNNLYLRLPQLNDEEKKFYESIEPLSYEEETIITILKILEGLDALGSTINFSNDQFIVELIDKVIAFLKKQTELNQD